MSDPAGPTGHAGGFRSTPPFDDVTDVGLWRVRLPLVAPHLSAHGATSVRETVVVEVRGADGVGGWGECVALSEPGYSSETTDSVWEALPAAIAAALHGDRRAVADLPPMAAAGLRDAALDRVLRGAGVALADALGGSRREVRSCAVIGLGGSLDELVARVAARVSAGHVHIKVKIRPGWDVEPLRAVRAAFPEVLLSADANGSYAEDDPALAVLDTLELQAVEQPLSPARGDDGFADLTAHAALAARWETKVVLDESIDSPARLAPAIARRALDGLNLKPGRVGGVLAAKAMADEAVTLGLPVFVGGMLETGIGRAAALGVAAHPACVWPTDLGPSDQYFARDLTRPIVAGPGATLVVPTGPGLGVTPDLDRLEALAVAQRRIAR